MKGARFEQGGECPCPTPLNEALYMYIYELWPTVSNINGTILKFVSIKSSQTLPHLYNYYNYTVVVLHVHCLNYEEIVWK